MSEELRFNMCNLDTSYKQNFEVPDLPDRIRKGIPLELQYSCSFFLDHVLQGNCLKDAQLQKQLESFFASPKVIFWVEALALMDKILNVDTSKDQVTVQAGARVQEVVEAIRPYGLTLQNYASIREQSIGGFTQVRSLFGLF